MSPFSGLVKTSQKNRTEVVVAENPTNKQKNAAKRVVGKEIRNGRETWRVASTGGHIKTVRIRVSSKRAIDEAVTVYSRALQRLANR
jgi:hypothetical protein